PVILYKRARARGGEVDSGRARHDPCDVRTAHQEAVQRAKRVESVHAVGNSSVDGDALETGADLQEMLASRMGRGIGDLDIGLTAIAVADVRRPEVSDPRNDHAGSLWI